MLFVHAEPKTGSIRRLNLDSGGICLMLNPTFAILCFKHNNFNELQDQNNINLIFAP